MRSFWYVPERRQNIKSSFLKSPRSTDSLHTDRISCCCACKVRETTDQSDRGVFRGERAVRVAPAVSNLLPRHQLLWIYFKIHAHTYKQTRLLVIHLEENTPMRHHFKRVTFNLNVI